MAKCNRLTLLSFKGLMASLVVKVQDGHTGFHDDVNHLGVTSQGALVDGQARLVSGRGELDSQSVKLYRVCPSLATHSASRDSMSPQSLSGHYIKHTDTVYTVPGSIKPEVVNSNVRQFLSV